MALRFNAKTGEWDEVPDSPTHRDPVARLGLFFRSFYDSSPIEDSWWLCFIGVAIIFVGLLWLNSAMPLLGLPLLIFAIVGMCFEKTRDAIMLVAYLVMLPITFALRWICYSRWSLLAAIALAIGLAI